MPRTCLSQIALLIEALVISLLFGSSSAYAGGFAVQEQSTAGLGAAYAGIATGHELSSTFWNPAGVSAADGIEAEVDGVMAFPDTHLSGTSSFQPAAPLDNYLGSSVPLSFLDSGSGSYADPTFIPSSYGAMQVNDRLTIGYGFNGAFGFVTKPSNGDWAGQYDARTSDLKTYNFNPVVSYKVTPTLVLGAGAQIEYAKVRLLSSFPNLPALATLDVAGAFGGTNQSFTIKGDGYGYGYTLGAIWTPLKGTTLGFGYRSQVDHTLEGHASLPSLGDLNGTKVSADLAMPAIATASIRQAINPRLALLGTVQWTNWSELDRIVIKAKTSNPYLGTTAGQPLTVLPLNWHDGWFFSTGVEYAYNARTVLRGGVAYEESPIQASSERTLRDPDTDRVWLSLGAGYKWNEATTINFAYSHVFFANGNIDRTVNYSVGDVRFSGQVENQIDLVALSVNIKLGKP